MAIITYTPGTTTNAQLATAIVNAIWGVSGSFTTPIDTYLEIQINPGSGSTFAAPSPGLTSWFYATHKATPQPTSGNKTLKDAFDVVTQLVFSGNAVSIGQAAFYNPNGTPFMPALACIDFGSVTEIQSWAFQDDNGSYMKNLSCIDFGSIAMIRHGAFLDFSPGGYYMKSLKCLKFNPGTTLESSTSLTNNSDGSLGVFQSDNFRNSAGSYMASLECISFGANTMIGTHAFRAESANYMPALQCMDFTGATVENDAFQSTYPGSYMSALTCARNYTASVGSGNTLPSSSNTASCTCYCACGCDCVGPCQSADKATIVFEDCCLDWTNIKQALLNAYNLGVRYAWCGRTNCSDGISDTCGVPTYIAMTAVEYLAAVTDSTIFCMLCNNCEADI